MSEEIATRRSPYTVIDVAHPWLAAVTSGADGVEVLLTDLQSHYRARSDRRSVHQQIEDYGGASDDQMLNLLHECLDGTKDASLFAFRVRDEQPPVFEWELQGAVCFSSRAPASPDAPARLRDELLLPLLLRAVLPSAGRVGSLVPDLGRPNVLAMVHRHTQTGDGGGPSAASGDGGAASAVVVDVDALPAPALPAPSAAAAPSAEQQKADEADERKRAAQAKRAAAAKKSRGN